MTAAGCAAASGLDPLLMLYDGQPPVLLLAPGVLFACVLMFCYLHAVPVLLVAVVAAVLQGVAPLPALLQAGLDALLVCLAVQVLRTFPLQPFPRMRDDHYCWFIAAALVMTVGSGADDAWTPQAPFYV